jgi:ribosome-associated toxin RatA of RatAB toxin-antitoxin module
MTTALALHRAVAKTRLAVTPTSIRLQAAVTVPHSQEQVWSVVADYDNLGRFMPNLRSQIVERNGSRLLVEQIAGSSLLPLVRFRLLLEFERRSPERLEFRRRAGSLATFDGSWSVTAQTQGSHVHYQLDAQHRFPLPSSLLRSAIRSDTQKIMPAIEAELRRRYGGGRTRGSVALP